MYLGEELLDLVLLIFFLNQVLGNIKGLFKLLEDYIIRHVKLNRCMKIRYFF
jgi:hypothetical protein